MTYVDLRRVRLRAGEEQRDEEDVAIAPLLLGGQRYVAVPETVPVDLRMTRTTSGTLFELGFHVRLHGPCFRCLEDAVLDQQLAAREYQAENPDGDEELISPYVDDSRLDLSSWVRDTVVLALPDKILCREDCAGLCATCGRDLNREPHEHEADTIDPRWAELAKLKDAVE